MLSLWLIEGLDIPAAMWAVFGVLSVWKGDVVLSLDYYVFRSLVMTPLPNSIYC